MHLLSDKYRKEFLGVPALCRMTMARKGQGREPTLLIKLNTLAIKMIITGANLEFVAKKRAQDNTLTYGIYIYDDEEHPQLVWSVAECRDEIDALESFISNEYCFICIFNELAINVLFANSSLFRKDHRFVDIDTVNVDLGFKMTMERQREIEDDFPSSEMESNRYWDIRFKLESTLKWSYTKNIYICNSLRASEIEILNTDEGRQQEELALWLCDNLLLAGVAINPEIEVNLRRRELCDLFFGYENGVFLIESKSISLFSRSGLPDRNKIQGTLLAHLKKATRQLSGACRRIKNGAAVYFMDKEITGFSRKHIPHCIVIVSDLDELSQVRTINIEIIEDFFKTNEGMLHLLDLSDLLRLVQGANLCVKNGAMSILHYFDYLLIKRWERTIETREAIIHMLINKHK